MRTRFSPERERSVATALAVVVLLSLSGCGGTVSAPTAFVPFADKGGQFVCDSPQGWESESGGKPDSPSSFAKFTKGSAKISIITDLGGSLMGDIAKSSGAMFGGDAEHPSAKVHAMGDRRMKQEFTNYEEREPKVVHSAGLGEGRRSTFIADGMLGGKVYGYRATFLGGDRRIEVLCTCPATNWKDLKPAFEKIIASLRR